MARGENQKQKLFRILEILFDRTDEEHGITTAELISVLSEYGISAERKSIYDDFLALGELGFTVEKLPTRPATYTLVERVFELAELKLLVDAVQSSKFITAERSRALIEKLKIFAGRHKAGELSRQVWVEGRAKTMNKSSIYTIDAIHSAINGGLLIEFRYFYYNAEKERAMRRGGAVYHVAPLALIWSEENYYLVGYDEDQGDVRNYRVDKMIDVCISNTPPSEEAKSHSLNSADYSRSVFGMYGGEETLVTLWCRNSIANVIVDRFGTEPTFVKDGYGFRVSVRVRVSPNFFAWLMSLGPKIRIIEPKSVRDSFVAELSATLGGYEE